MNKNAVYLAIFAALCVLAGVLVGAAITKRPHMPWHGGPQGKPNFAERAERFMGYGPRDSGREPRRVPGNIKNDNGPIERLTVKLGLNAEQKTKVTEILENTRQQIDEVGKNVRNSITEIREKGDKLIMDVLTPQQQEKFKALQKEFEGCRGPRGPEGEYGQMQERGPRPGEELPPPRE